MLSLSWFASLVLDVRNVTMAMAAEFMRKRLPCSERLYECYDPENNLDLY